MEALRVGGIASGLDTNAIIDSLMTAAKQPIDALNKQVTILGYQRNVYNSVINSVSLLKNSLLTMKLESTFKSKDVTSTAPAVGSATAGINTPAGIYNLTVNRLAKNSTAITNIPQLSLFPGNTNISAIKERNGEYLKQLMGMHTISIEEKNGVGAIATDKFTSDGKTFGKYVAGAPTAFSPTGNLTRPINNEDLNFRVTIDGVVKDINLTLNYSTSPTKFMQEIAHDIEKQINDKLGVANENMVFVKTELDANNRTVFSLYTNSDKPMEIAATSITTLSEAFGFTTSTGGNLTPKVATKEITNQVISDTLVNLQTKVTSDAGGLIPGLKIDVKAGETLKAGVTVVNYDDTVNRKIATKSSFFGAQFSKFKPTGTPPVTPSYSKAQIDKWLNSSLNSTNIQKMKPDGTTDSGTVPSFFDKVGSTDTTNGFFHINGVKITIDDAGKLTPNELMAKINSSGAGVTARFDYESNTFILENNNKGTADIKLGQSGDTSDILTVLGVAVTAGSTYVRGSDAGTISLTSTLDQAGFSTAVTAGIFTINGVSIFVDPARDTVNDLINKVNKSGANVRLTYDSYIDKFKLESNGNVGRIEVGSANDSSTFLKSIGITKDISTKLEPIGTAGNKSEFVLNGITYERDTNDDIKDVVTEMSINLLSVGTTTINVSIDTDRAVDAMADFATTYNNLMAKLTPSLVEKEEKEKYWEILSEEKKKGMSEDDIKKYNENHIRIREQYIILSSPELKSLKNQLRSNLMDPVSNSSPFKKITDIGLNIAGGNSGDYKLTQKGLFIADTTDKDTMKKVIKDIGTFEALLVTQPDEMFTFFNDKKVDTVNGVKTENKGWGVKYDEFATRNSNSTSALYKKAGIGGSIESQMNRLQQQIEVQTKRAEQYLQRMWNEFAAMENRVQEIQAQSAALGKIGSGAPQ